jgi:hypothetical protein
MYVFRSPPHPRGIEHKSIALPLRGEERGRSRLFREEGVVETYPSGNDTFGKGGFINIWVSKTDKVKPTPTNQLVPFVSNASPIGIKPGFGRKGFS